MARREGLAEGAGVIGLHALIGHLLHAIIPCLVLAPGPLCKIIHIFLVGIEGHLDLVQDVSEVLMEFCMENSADILQGEALFYSRFTDPDPCDVSLSDVHDALGIVDQMVDLSLQNGFKVDLHLASGYLYVDA